MTSSAVRQLSIHRLRIPLRRSVTHAQAKRNETEPIVVSVELGNGAVGYGETLARPYVTGESTETVIESINRIYLPACLDLRPAHFPAALEAIDALPFHDDAGRLLPASRAAVELGLLDAYSRFFGRPLSDVPGWMGLTGFGEPGSLRRIRYSGVLASDSLRSTRRTLRLLWWYGIRDFKLKIGRPDDADRLDAVMRRLRASIARGRASLRVDVNGAWTFDEAFGRLELLQWQSIAGIEQPLEKGLEEYLPRLKDAGLPPIFHDESLVTMDDAQKLVDLNVADGFNIRLSKCGGLMPSLRLADFARKNGTIVQLGCMVGETSILSAAGRRFLELAPNVAFAEGSFGKFLLSADVIPRPLTFGYGGRVRPLAGQGWGIEVHPGLLERLSVEKPTVHVL